MPAEETEKDTTQYAAVVNHEEQYSIWPLGREIPLGWRDTGTHGTKDQCLAWIETVWTDMRPLSLRKAMEEMANTPPPPPRPAPVDDLVDRLTAGSHPVELLYGDQYQDGKYKDHLDQDLDANHVHIRFPNTRGGTELGLNLDPAKSIKTGDKLHLEANLTLNFEKVRVIADIDRPTLKGQGRLIRL